MCLPYVYPEVANSVIILMDIEILSHRLYTHDLYLIRFFYIALLIVVCYS